ncbi:MAG: tetratricopeptide repeat protein [Candidatus Eremiobacteraeota bacterium]|nr:tetratricopeptide repeat protein [Candidatus Eremiobacteraeota bacterium]
MIRKSWTKVFVVLLLLSFILVVGCQKKDDKEKTPAPDKSIKPTAKPSKTKKPRPVVNLTDDQKKTVKKLLDEAKKLEGKNKNFKAIDILEKVILIDPNNLEAYEIKGRLARRQGMQNAAIEAYENAIELDPKNANGYYGLGKVYLTIKDYDSAIESYNKLTQVQPKMSQGFSALGETYFFQGHSNTDRDERVESYKKSVENFEKAVKISPKTSKFYFKLVESGYMWYYLSKDPKAREISMKYAKEFKKKFPKDKLMTNIKRKIAQIEAVRK